MYSNKIVNVSVLKKVAFLLIVLFSILIHLLTLNQIGRTWDEHAYVDTGYNFINLIRKGDILNSYFIQKLDHPPLMKYLYGVAAQFDATGRKLPNGENEFKYDFPAVRILSVALGVLATVLVILIGWEFISPLVGIIAGFIFTTLPVILAMTQLATIEAGTLFFFALALYCYLLLLKKYSPVRLALAGITLGFLLSVKFTNFVAVPIWLVIFLLARRANKAIFKPKYLLLIILIAVLVFAVLWPKAVISYGQVLGNIQKVRFLETAVPIELFLGKIQPVPVYYYLLYFFISIPLLYLVVFFIGSFYALGGKNWRLWAFLVVFILPFSLSFYRLRQNGLRYVIEIFIPFSLLAALGIQGVIQKLADKGLVWFIAILSLIVYALSYLKPITPYYLDYFNEIVGGASTVYKNHTFDLGFWGEGGKEAMQYVEGHALVGSSVALEFYPSQTFPYPPNFHFTQYAQDNKSDYLIVNYLADIRLGFDESKLLNNYDLVYAVKADQAELVHIYKIKPTQPF